MGSGKRLDYWVDTSAFVLGVAISRFPFALSVNVNLGVVHISIGLGRAYDQDA